jgi:hypothetical protein
MKYEFSFFEMFKASKDAGNVNLQLAAPSCFTEYQVEQFYNLKCFDKKHFDNYYPNNPEYRNFVISYLLSGIGIADQISPLPIEGSNKNLTKETASTIKQAIKELSRAINIIDKLPSAFEYANYLDSNTNETKQIYREGLRGYRDELKTWNSNLENHSKNELLLNRVFLAFKCKYGIPEYDNISETPLMNEIVSIFTGIDILDVPRTLQRYKDKLIQK